MPRNVDRLFAIYQAIYPNNFITSEADGGYGTFTIAPGTTENNTTGTHDIVHQSSYPLYVSHLVSPDSVKVLFQSHRRIPLLCFLSAKL